MKSGQSYSQNIQSEYSVKIFRLQPNLLQKDKKEFDFDEYNLIIAKKELSEAKLKI